MLNETMPRLRFGLMGNMGPEASEVLQRFIRQEMVNRGARTDQEALPMIVINNPRISDRTEAILNGGQDPMPEMLHTLREFESLNTFFMGAACNTWHYFRPELQKRTNVLIIDMIDTTCSSIKQEKPDVKLGLLATNGTVKAGVYDDYLRKYDIPFIKPNDILQQSHVHRAIYGSRDATGESLFDGLKHAVYDRNANLLVEVIHSLEQEGVNTIGLCCTELPLIQQQLQTKFPHLHFIDPMRYLAKRVVDIYFGVKKKIENDSLLPQKAKASTIKTLEQSIDYVYSLLKWQEREA